MIFSLPLTFRIFGKMVVQKCHFPKKIVLFRKKGSYSENFRKFSGKCGNTENFSEKIRKMRKFFRKIRKFSATFGKIRKIRKKEKKETKGRNALAGIQGPKNQESKKRLLGTNDTAEADARTGIAGGVVQIERESTGTGAIVPTATSTGGAARVICSCIVLPQSVSPT